MSVARFYDELADDYHLIYPDWEASLRRQGEALHALIGMEQARVLDCSCGIGTQAIGLALRGHRVTGTDLSPRAAARAAREGARRNVSLHTAAADMRCLPFPDGRFDVVVCADNALPHLLTEHDVRTALAEMRRVLRPAGLLLVSTRPYDRVRRPRVAVASGDRLLPAATHRSRRHVDATDRQPWPKVTASTPPCSPSPGCTNSPSQADSRPRKCPGDHGSVCKAMACLSAQSHNLRS